MSPFWLAVCVSFDFAGTNIQPEVRWGAGLYQQVHFLHAKIHLTPDPLAMPRVGNTDPTRPVSPFRQFLECKR